MSTRDELREAARAVLDSTNDRATVAALARLGAALATPPSPRWQPTTDLGRLFDPNRATPPEPLDVERLARALHEWPKHTAGHHFDTCPYEQGYRQEAARVAAEYARLSAQEDAP